MSDDGVGLRWGVGRRIAFLDACLFWAGRVNRSDLVRHFGISIPQASVDLARYVELAPDNAVYDRSRKTYLRGTGFRPVLHLPSAMDVLAELERTEERQQEADTPPWAADVTAERAVPRTDRKLDDTVLQGLLAAIRERRLIEMTYQSFSHPQPTVRWIAPHAFADDGDRWHVRAYCATHHDFRDFVVSRITGITGERDCDIESNADRGWHSITTLHLAANPALEQSAKRSLEAEHRMSNGLMEMNVRTCFAYYVKTRLGLDLDDGCVPPLRKQLVLVNAEEVARSETNALAETQLALSRLQTPEQE